MPDTDAARHCWRAGVTARQTADMGRLARGARRARTWRRCPSTGWEHYGRHSVTCGACWRVAAGAGDDGHRATFQVAAEEAGSALAGANTLVVLRARSRLGSRAAVMGKRGTGKSFIVATVVRLLARRGRLVLAVDFDTKPGLAHSLGCQRRRGAARGCRHGTPRERRTGGGFAAGSPGRGGRAPRRGRARRRAVPQREQDRQRRQGCLKRAVAALRQMVAGFGEPGWDVIGDMEAGPTTTFRALPLRSPTRPWWS